MISSDSDPRLVHPSMCSMSKNATKRARRFRWLTTISGVIMIINGIIFWGIYLPQFWEVDMVRVCEYFVYISKLSMCQYCEHCGGECNYEMLINVSFFKNSHFFTINASDLKKRSSVRARLRVLT